MQKKRIPFGSTKDHTDWARIDAMKDEDIDYSDIPEADENFWKNAKPVRFKIIKKQPVTMRLDEGIIDWFKKQTEHNNGRGYQTYINTVLRAFVAGKWKLKNS